MYMFLQNFIKLSAAVHELSCSQCDSAENNTAFDSAGSSNAKSIPKNLNGENLINYSFERRRGSRK